MATPDNPALTLEELRALLGALDDANRVTGPATVRASLAAQGLAYRLDTGSVMLLTGEGKEVAYAAKLAAQGKTAEPPFTNSAALEDSALLTAVETSGAYVNAPDNDRLVACGLAAKEAVTGRYYLTDSGYAAARALRDRERPLMPFDLRDLVAPHRATAKRSGWIPHITFIGRVYLEMVRLPHTGPAVFAELLRGTWTNVAWQLRSKLGVDTEVIGARLYLNAPSEAFKHQVSALGHAAAVWNDLGIFHRLRMDDDGHTVFHHNSRTVALTPHETTAMYRATITSGPDSGRSWDGHRPDVAVTAMAIALYGTPCDHGYGTGRDSCPGCDATDEEFEDTYPTPSNIDASARGLFHL